MAKRKPETKLTPAEERRRRAETVFITYKRLPDHGIPYCRQYIRRLIDASKFPAPVRIGPNRVAWPVETIKAWLDERLKKVDRGGVQ
jgi:hypothetical protein